MKFAEFFSGQRVIKQLLDFFNLSKEEAIKERQTDAYTDGVVDTELNNLAIIGKDIDPTLIDFFSIKLDTGVAHKTGERILVDDASLTFDATNISDTTDDGFGNPISTPHSTGTFDIPLVPGSINHVYIAYLQTTDETEFTTHKIFNTKQFYKRTDGYEVVTNTTGVNPDSARFIFLGQVDLSGGNQAITANISITGREIYRVKGERVEVITPNIGKTDRPAVYGLGNEVHNVTEHTKCVGGGDVTPTNPHGITAADLGLTEDELVRFHRQKEHDNGLIAGSPGQAAPQTSAMFVERVIVGIGDDFVRVKPLISGEVAIVDGLAFTESNFPSEVIITFITSTDPAGTYTIFFDSVTGQVAKTTSVVIGDPTKLRLAVLDWDDAGSLGPPTELRRFGTSNILQRWFTSSRPPAPLRGQKGYNLDLDQAEYFNGTSWVQY